MSLFDPNIPQPGDFLSDSQDDLLTNNSGLDTVFNIDHYKFSDATAMKGKHNQVTTPKHDPASHPVIATGEPRLYAMEDSVNIGVIQYSAGDKSIFTNTVPSPLTRLHGEHTAALAGGSTENILDFAGITRAIGIMTCVSMSSITTLGQASLNIFAWNGSILNVNKATVTSTVGVTQTPPIIANVSGTILQIYNQTGSNVDKIYWSIEFMRLE